LSSLKQNRKNNVCDKEDNQIDVLFEEILQIEAGESQNLYQPKCPFGIMKRWNGVKEEKDKDDLEYL
jgi:hypothetical protein